MGLHACTDATYGIPDLPEDWMDAARVERFAQSGCEDAAVESPAELSSSVADGTIELRYAHASFRCQQDVEAYVRTRDRTFDVLIQPINLNPPLLTRCTCQYTLSFVLPAPKKGRLPTGGYQINVFRRLDHLLEEENDPIAVGSQNVDLP